jgi:cell division protein FtsZ
MSAEQPILLVGVGGAGCALVGQLSNTMPPGIRTLAVDADASSLVSCGVVDQVQIGRAVLRGLGAGGEAKMGASAAEADLAELRRWVAGPAVVVFVTGLGGGVSGGATSVLASLAAEAGAVVLGLVTLPFTHEGEHRQSSARDALIAINLKAHGVVVLRNDDLLQLVKPEAPATEMFAETRRWMGSALESLSGFFAPGALMPLDPGALRALFPSLGCLTIFATGEGEGATAVVSAARAALASPLLPHGPEAVRIDHLLVQVIGGPSLTTGDCQAAVALLRAELGGDRVTLLGARMDGALEGKARVSLLGASPPAPPGKVKAVKGKRPSKAAIDASQQMFVFALEQNLRRGLFGGTEPTLFNGEDMDVPTYLRKGIRIQPS